MALNAAVLKAMEMIHSETASPALPGFGRSPMVRQLRVTDSPFPLSNVGDSHVDEAAEQFISRFYNDLRRQNTKVAFGSRAMDASATGFSGRRLLFPGTAGGGGNKDQQVNRYVTPFNT
ncbi:hypothetical protein L1987_52003 [Smallanthus sonchifolius]|uniref:Uncharacterized protein n=1 Tax=Smallanthus sonchifolius TaxID=185202 RepID=A0ACB9ESM8_9ASTR|nr:hypothetical protein L1987_52003 [Smallanthus sonchifolius]